MKEKFSIGIIGAGVMGEAIAVNLLKKKAVERGGLAVSDRSFECLNFFKKNFGVAVFEDAKMLGGMSRYIILAVKPQDFLLLAKEIAPSLKKDSIVISIMAGVPIRKIKSALRHERVVRSMPNLGVRVGRGFILWKAGFKISPRERKVITAIFSACGRAVEVYNERWLDKATAVSGSGPAYFYYFIEAFIKAAEKLGFSAELARQMADETIGGALELYHQSGEKAKVLREKVTSKKGTTEAALKVFKESDLKKIIERGIRAAYRRAQELSKLSI